MKLALMVTLVVGICLLAFTYVTWAANKKVERQKYRLIKKEKGFEIRFYPKAIMATLSTVRANNGNDANSNFRTLAGYIFGGNKEEQKIAMTAPVHMEKDSNDNRMSFVLPAQYQISELPHPNDSSVKIHYSDEGYYACLAFGGFANEHKIKHKEEELKEMLGNAGYTITGHFSYLAYNAPWELINRENEIIVKVNYSK
jgi:hypothetical protein